mgnify:CR=1 FL=1
MCQRSQWAKSRHISGHAATQRAMIRQCFADISGCNLSSGSHTQRMKWIHLFISSCLALLLPGTLIAEGFEGGGEALTQEAKLWVAEQTGHVPSEIQIGTLDRRTPIESCAKKLQFRFPFQSNIRTVEASCRDPEWKRFIRVKIEAIEQIVASVKALPAGHRLTAKDITLVPKPTNFTGGYSRLDDVNGLTLSIEVNARQPLSQEMMAQVQTVFVPIRSYEPGEPIEFSDISLESIDTESVVLLNAWPNDGIVTATQPILAGKPIQLDQVELSEYVVVSSGPIIRGQVITSDLVSLELMPKQSLGKQTLSRLEEASGMEATRTMRAGTIITPSDLIAADLVRKGENVSLTIQRGSLTITVDTVALDNAKQGEQVELMNPDSGKTIRGIVTGRYEARGIGP